MAFKGKSAFVTGAAGGMGAKISEGLLQQGAEVALFDLDLPPDLGAGAAGFKGDVTKAGDLADAVTQFTGKTGGLDYLVNAAGVLWFGRDRSIADIDLEIWDRVVEINLKGAALAARTALPHLRRGGGAMVHIATIQCLRGDSRPQDAYQAAKAGLVALSKSLAIQFAGDGVRSNCILPGPTATPMQQRWDDDPGTLAALAAAVPLGRVGTAEDIAEACLFLLSDRASFITGTDLIVDGGLTALP